jgi:hypothetical protein
MQLFHSKDVAEFALRHITFISRFFKTAMTAHAVVPQQRSD